MKLNDIIIAQYNSLRQEILDLNTHNEKIYSNTIILVGATWSALLTIIFSNTIMFIPGIIFLIPSIYLISSISKYITNDNRIANISSYIGKSYKKYFTRNLNWETSIGKFARSGNFDLSSKFSNIFVYTVLLYLSVVLSFLVSIGYLIQRKCDIISIIDFVLILIFSISIIIVFLNLKKKRIPFGERKKILDKIWKSIQEEKK